MDNADGIMIVTLRQAGCIIPEEITSLQQFTPEIFMPACCVMLNTIDSSLDLPSFIPYTGPEKFRHSTNITKALKKVGYREECGYHLFLYPNEADTKKIISFLVERLPRTDSRGDSGPEIIGSNTLFGQLQSQVRISSTQPWLLPAFQKPRPFDHFLYHFTHPTINSVIDDPDEYYRELNQKAKGGKEGSNVNLRLNAISLLKRNISMSSLGHLSTVEDSSALRVTFPEGSRARKFGRLAHSALFSQENESDEVDLEAATAGGASAAAKETRESQIQALQESIDAMQREINDLQREMETEGARTEKIQTSVVAMQKDTAKLEEEVKVASLLAAMLPDVDNSILKLNALNEKVIGRVRQLNAEWENHRAALITRYHNLVDEHRGKKSESFRLTEKIKEIRREMGRVVDDAKGRQTVLQQLKEEYEGMNKSANRSVYMKKVNDMHCNLSQQRVDIDNLITDMRTLMTETTLAEERLGRAFKEAEGMLSTAYEQNKKDDAYGAVYRRFNNFDQNYTELKEAYEGIGAVLNQLLDMDERILDQGRFETDKKMGKVKKDYDELKKENNDLRTKIEVLKS